MSKKRYFGIDEVSAAIPELQGICTRLLQLHPHLRSVGDRLARLGYPPTIALLGDEARFGGPADVRQLQARFRVLYEQIGSEVHAVESLGGQIKDIEAGLVDFPALLQGREEVLLCWRIGEKEIRFFHDVDSGFGGRQPIEDNEFVSRPSLDLH